MTVTTTVSSKTLSGNGVTKSFPFNFKFINNNDIIVFITDPDGNIATLTEGISDTQYSIIGAGSDSGSVTYPVGSGGVALPVGWTITIKRLMDYNQTLDLTNQSGIFLDVIEEAFDKTTMLIQQIVDGEPFSVSDEPDIVYFQPSIEYSEDLLIYLSNQSVEYGGVIYAPKPSYIPFVTTETFDENKWYPIQNPNYNGFIFPEQFGAIGDGEADDTIAVQNAIETGLSVRGIEGKIYAISSSLVMIDNSKLSKIKFITIGTRSDFTIAAIINENYNDSTGNSGILIEDVEITGFSDTKQTDATTITPSNIGVGGIYLAYIANCTIKKVKTNNTWTGIAIYLTPDGTDIEDANNIVEYCYINKAQGYSETGNAGTPRGIYFGTGGILRCNYAKDCATGFYVTGEGGRIVNNDAKNWYKDEGFYLVGKKLIVTLNRAIGNLGSGFAVAYNEKSFINNNYASGCTNMGFRIHAPQSHSVITNNHAENCGYGLRIENSLSITISSITRIDSTATVTTLTPHGLLTGRFFVNTGGDQSEYRGIFPVIVTGDQTFEFEVSGTPTTPATGTYIGYYTSQGLNISDNQFNNNDLCGIQLSYLVNSIIDTNHCYENNQDGVGASTRGGLSILGYCLNNNFSDNKCYDYQETPTQTFGFYNYDKASSGADVENSGNKVNHQSSFGDDYFGVEPVFNLIGIGSPEGVVTAPPASTYYNLSAGTSTTLYVKESGTGNTGWVAK